MILIDAEHFIKLQSEIKIQNVTWFQKGQTLTNNKKINMNSNKPKNNNYNYWIIGKHAVESALKNSKRIKNKNF